MKYGTEKIYFCDECTYYIKRLFEFPRCKNPKARRHPMELVKRKNYPECYRERDLGNCGEEGKLYKPIEIGENVYD